jgi:hypothetical protein
MIKTIKDAEQEGVLENCIYNADCLDLMPHMQVVELPARWQNN